jgi:hypothetical protein
VFVVDEKTFPVHRDRCFCGIGPGSGGVHRHQELLEVILHSARSGYRGMVVDVLGTRLGDLVFFYERGNGFHGVYRIAGRPFFDNTVVHGIGGFEDRRVEGNIFLRIPIECQDYFPKPVPEDMLFSTPMREATFWVWFYRKIQGPRGCTTIDPDAAQALTELLIKLNGRAIVMPPTEDYPNNFEPQLTLPLGDGPTANYEDLLRGWLIQNVDDPNRPDVRDIFGPESDLEWFANNVPYHVAGRNIDVLVFHSANRYSETPIRYKYSVVELKRDRATVKDVEQLLGYSRWVASRLAHGEAEIVQPILIANGFQMEAITRAVYSDWNIELVEYQVENEDITLRLVQRPRVIG